MSETPLAQPDIPALEPVNRAVWQSHVAAATKEGGLHLPPGAYEDSALAPEEEHIRRQFPSILERIRPHLAEGVRGGFVTERAAKRVERAFLHTPIRVVGGLATGQLGEYLPDQDVILLAPGLDKVALRKATVHEVGHQASGGTFKRHAETGKPVRTRFGFHNARDDDHPNWGTGFERYSELDEAVQEHLAQAYQHGDFETFDPDKRKGDEGPEQYYVRRKILADVIEKAQGAIDPRVITRASSEDTGEDSIELDDRRQMTAQFSSTYGLGSLRQYIRFVSMAEANCGDYPDDEEGRALLGQMLTAIVPPVIDETTRQVIKPGSFDLDKAIEIVYDHLFPPEEAL